MSVRYGPVCSAACGLCGVVFQYRGVRVARPRKYCSLACASRAVGLNGKARIRNPPARKTCALCGKEWTTFHRNQRFCSWGCSVRGKRHGGSSKDKNHDAIKAALEAAGVEVIDTCRVGGGFADLLAKRRDGSPVFLEVKNPDTWYGRRGPAPAQRKWRDGFPGFYFVVTTPEEALVSVGYVTGVVGLVG